MLFSVIIVLFSVMMYLPESPSTIELRNTAASISYAGQLLLGQQHSGGYDPRGQTSPFTTVADLQSVYDLQMEQR